MPGLTVYETGLLFGFMPLGDAVFQGPMGAELFFKLNIPDSALKTIGCNILVSDGDKLYEVRVGNHADICWWWTAATGYKPACGAIYLDARTGAGREDVMDVNTGCDLSGAVMPTEPPATVDRSVSVMLLQGLDVMYVPGFIQSRVNGGNWTEWSAAVGSSQAVFSTTCGVTVHRSDPRLVDHVSVPGATNNGDCRIERKALVGGMMTTDAAWSGACGPVDFAVITQANQLPGETLGLVRLNTASLKQAGCVQVSGTPVPL